MIEFKIDNEAIKVSIDKIDGYTRFYDDDSDEEEKLFFKSQNRYKLYRCVNNCFDNIDFSTSISDIVITFYSQYRSMKPKHRFFNHPKTILELQILKNIKNKNNRDKFENYKFLSKVYNLYNY